MGRCSGAGGKGANNAKGKGYGKGSGKNQNQAPQGKGCGYGHSQGAGSEAMKGMMKSVDKLVAKMGKMETKFEKLGVSSKPSKEQESTWTCTHCKAEKCFASRSTCYKCGESKEPKVPTPPGLGAKTVPPKATTGQPVAEQEPVVVDSEEEVETLEDRISELEENLKFYKGKDTAFANSVRPDLEAQLKILKEQQKQARPLPARL